MKTPPDSQGVIYVAYGDNARNEARISAGMVTEKGYLPVSIISDQPLDSLPHIYAPDRDWGGRLAKLNLDILSPYRDTLYLDADTRPYQDLFVIFALLADGFDLIITPSVNQHGECLIHLSEQERDETWAEVGYIPLQLQGGLFAFRKSAVMSEFFAVWRDEWQRYQDQDQGAMLRALHKVPLRLWLLGRPFNGGAVVGHRFGTARRATKERV